MKPLRLHGVRAAGLLLMVALGSIHATDVKLESIVTYKLEADCKNVAETAMKVVATIKDPCTPSTTCTITDEVYPATQCTTTDGTSAGDFYATFLPSIFGDAPYVVVQKYTDAATCADPEDIETVTAYLANGICHKTGTAESFAAVKTSDGAAKILTYGTADCSGTTSDEVVISAQQANVNSCATGANGVADTKIYGSTSATTVYIDATGTFDTDTGTCKNDVVPVMLTSSDFLFDDTCEDSTTCTASGELYSGTRCSTTASYREELATLFDTTPFVIVESYAAGKACAGTELESIAVYVADGKCHKTGGAASYIATRSEAALSEVTVYGDATCGTPATGYPIEVTAAQFSTSCSTSAGGVDDKLVYGGGFTPLYLQSTASFEKDDDDCVSPGMPTYLETTVVAADACSATDACAAAGDLFTRTLCSSTAAFKDDADTVFDSTPYIVVQTYTAAKDCAVTSLTGSKTYAADAKCHATAADASFFATRSESGDMTITFYSDATCETKDGDPLEVAAGDAEACSDNQIVYGVGASPTVKSTILSYDDNACAIPAQLVVSDEFSCSASTTCTATEGHYLKHDCSEDHFAAAEAMFGDAPYVVVELFKDEDCSTLSGVQAYSSDKECHVAIDGTSFRSTLADTGDGDVVLYADDKCEATGDDKSTMALSLEMLGDGNPCTDSAKYYAFNGPPPPPNSTPASTPSSTPSSTTKTPSSTTKTPTTPSTTTATPSSTTEAPTTTSTGSGTSDAASLFPTFTASLGLLAAAFGLLL